MLVSVQDDDNYLKPIAIWRYIQDVTDFISTLVSVQDDDNYLYCIHSRRFRYYLNVSLCSR